MSESPFWVICPMVQGIMVASVFLASKVDDIIAKSQRRELGLCEECGGLYNLELCQEGNCPSKGKSSAQL